ncbi:MAG: hypothetical protein KatS3mg024_2522 [Armatimonadota bacterium]|nr:MAG: hypothetical protein KatS3mg024_2522 [Armatimonadota bacterium]
MQIPMADLQAQHRALAEEIDSAIREVLESCRFILGPNVSALEEEVARYCEARYAVGVNSGTDALILALAACGIGPGDEVITTPFTFVATTEAIIRVGAMPVFVDIDPVTFNMDAALVESRITERSRALLPVHLYGQTADLTALKHLAERYSLKLISDGAQAIGAQHNGMGIGQFGDAVTLSFFPTKNLGGLGDGGMVLTNSEEVAERLRLLRFHGSGGTYSYREVGWCSRLDELQAAVLRVKLRHLPEWTARRAANAARYAELLEGCGIRLPQAAPGNKHVWHQYTVATPQRTELQAFLKDRGIASAVYYPGALHLEEAYRHLGGQEGDFPEAERACREVLSLPVFPELPEGAVDRVAQSVLDFCGV